MRQTTCNTGWYGTNLCDSRRIPELFDPVVGLDEVSEVIYPVIQYYDGLGLALSLGD